MYQHKTRLLIDCYFRATPSIPPSTTEQSSKTPSKRSISSRSRKFSFRSNFTSPGSAGDDDLRDCSQFAARLPRRMSPGAGDDERATENVSSSSAPRPESLHHPESSPSDPGLILLSTQIDVRVLGSVISVRRDAWDCEVMSNCALSAEFDMRKSASCSVMLRRVD
jgi:hypothetical protein